MPRLVSLVKANKETVIVCYRIVDARARLCRIVARVTCPADLITTGPKVMYSLTVAVARTDHRLFLSFFFPAFIYSDKVMKASAGNNVKVWAGLPDCVICVRSL